MDCVIPDPVTFLASNQLFFIHGVTELQTARLTPLRLCPRYKTSPDLWSNIGTSNTQSGWWFAKQDDNIARISISDPLQTSQGQPSSTGLK